MIIPASWVWAVEHKHMWRLTSIKNTFLDSEDQETNISAKNSTYIYWPITLHYTMCIWESKMKSLSHFDILHEMFWPMFIKKRHCWNNFHVLFSHLTCCLFKWKIWTNMTSYSCFLCLKFLYLTALISQKPLVLFCFKWMLRND